MPQQDSVSTVMSMQQLAQRPRSAVFQSWCWHYVGAFSWRAATLCMGMTLASTRPAEWHTSTKRGAEAGRGRAGGCGGGHEGHEHE
eukprot:SAG31_NODE_14528_length_801_cov_1.497151_1_plen_85_part_10